MKGLGAARKVDGLVLEPGREGMPVVLLAEEPFELLVESVTDYAIFLLDPGGIVSTWNMGAERIKGYRAEEIIGEHFSKFYPAEAIAAGWPMHELEEATRVGRYEDEGWRLRKDGTRLWANVVITALRGRDGRLVGFGKVTRDLTERRTAEVELRASNDQQAVLAEECSAANAYLKSIFDAPSVTSIIATDPSGFITIFNRGAQMMLGYTELEVVGKCTQALFHLEAEVEERGRSLSKLLGRAVNGFDVFVSSIEVPGFDNTEWTYVRKGGDLLLVTLSVSAVLGASGEVVGYLGVAEDVTARRKAAKEVEAAYARLNAVLESTSDSVVTIGHDWTMLYANRKAMESLPDFVLGKDYWSYFPAVLGTSTEMLLRKGMTERCEIMYEIFYAPYDTWYRAQGFPTAEGLSIFFSDITEEKKMQQQLEMEQMLREKRIEGLSHMAGGLAHEISNPLAIIHARASDLMREAGDGVVSAAEVQEACGSIVATSDRAMRILRGLRGFGREASKDPMEAASIYEIVEECVELQESRFERHGVSLRLALAEELPLLLCRATQVGQIVTNLLNNSFDAIVQGGAGERWIELSAMEWEGYLTVQVTDSGPAIEEQYKAHLMEPFFTTKEFGLGTGVGLSLSRAIAQDHGGTLIFCGDSANTCFRLLLPVEPDAQYRNGGGA